MGEANFLFLNEVEKFFTLCAPLCPGVLVAKNRKKEANANKMSRNY